MAQYSYNYVCTCICSCMLVIVLIMVLCIMLCTMPCKCMYIYCAHAVMRQSNCMHKNYIHVSVHRCLHDACIYIYATQYYTEGEIILECIRYSTCTCTWRTYYVSVVLLSLLMQRELTYVVLSHFTLSYVSNDFN